MLSRAQIKYIRSLTQQKYRKEHSAFLAEGTKLAEEWLRSSVEIKMIIGLEEWMEKHQALVSTHTEAEVIIVNDERLRAISNLQTPNKVLLVVSVPAQTKQPSYDRWTLALDTIQDPGNLGTLIRIADWFGISQIVCSPGCADIYNPKVVQSAMGGHLRIDFFTSELDIWLSQVKIPVVAATLEGVNLYQCEPLQEAVLLIGNESRGLESGLVGQASMVVTIPGRGGAESLNAAVSAGIICSHLIPH